MGVLTADQLRRVRDLDGDRGGWLVAIRDLSYRGRVIAPADADAEWIVERLDGLAGKLDYPVTCGRLASRQAELLGASSGAIAKWR